MKIQMEKRKPGVYSHWFEIEGMSRGKRVTFLIYYYQAKNYAQAIRFWNDKFAGRNGNMAFLLKNAEPFHSQLCLAC